MKVPEFFEIQLVVSFTADLKELGCAGIILPLPGIVKKGEGDDDDGGDEEHQPFLLGAYKT